MLGHIFSQFCPPGTERCNEAVDSLRQKFDIVVNIQGDEPLIEPEIIDAVVESLQNAPEAVYRFVQSPKSVLNHMILNFFHDQYPLYHTEA